MSHPIVTRCRFGAQLLGVGQHSNTGAAVATVYSNEQEFRFDETVLLTLLESTADAHEIKLFGRRVVTVINTTTCRYFLVRKNFISLSL